MARKYARDNRGRFASTGSGATARGGRLKTASGNKRATQAMQAKGGRAGTIGKPKGLKPGANQARAAAKSAPQLAVSKIQKTRSRFGDDDFQSDRRWARNETAKLDRQKKRLEKELAGLKRAQAAASKPVKPAAKPVASKAAVSAIKPGPRNVKNVVGLSRARPGQLQRALGRAVTNMRNVEDAAIKGTESRTRAGISFSIAKGAQGYYTGSIKRTAKATFSPLTASRDKKALAARKRRIVDNNKKSRRKPR